MSRKTITGRKAKNPTVFLNFTPVMDDDPDWPTEELKQKAFAAGKEWGMDFGTVDHAGGWSYDGRLMPHYIEGCNAGVRIYKQRQEEE